MRASCEQSLEEIQEREAAYHERHVGTSCQRDPIIHSLSGANRLSVHNAYQELRASCQAVLPLPERLNGRTLPDVEYTDCILHRKVSATETEADERRVGCFGSWMSGVCDD
jgi:hypothetical protein